MVAKCLGRTEESPADLVVTIRSSDVAGRSDADAAPIVETKLPSQAKSDREMAPSLTILPHHVTVAVKRHAQRGFDVCSRRLYCKYRGPSANGD